MINFSGSFSENLTNIVSFFFSTAMSGCFS